MGYMRHHAIIVTGYEQEAVEEMRKVAVGLWNDVYTGHGDHLVSPVVASPMNGYYSFCVFPDGSKEGWVISKAGDEIRDALIETLNTLRFSDKSSPFDWVEFQYGDDGRVTRITRHSDDYHDDI